MKTYEIKLRPIEILKKNILFFLLQTHPFSFDDISEIITEHHLSCGLNMFLTNVPFDKLSSYKHVLGNVNKNFKP